MLFNKFLIVCLVWTKQGSCVYIPLCSTFHWYMVQVAFNFECSRNKVFFFLFQIWHPFGEKFVSWKMNNSRFLIKKVFNSKKSGNAFLWWIYTEMYNDWEYIFEVALRKSNGNICCDNWIFRSLEFDSKWRTTVYLEWSYPKMKLPKMKQDTKFAFKKTIQNICHSKSYTFIWWLWSKTCICWNCHSSKQ